jgi:hypothetical protein
MINPDPRDEPDTSEEAVSRGDLLPEDESRQGDDEGASEEVEQIASLVIARIENKLEQHLYTQMELPDPDQAAELRDKAPEVYQLWIDIARKKADSEVYVQSAQYQVPERLARTGRPWALAALFLVLVFCAYIASLGGSAVYVAGIIAALDLVAMLGLFLGFRPELAADSRRPSSKALSRKEKAIPPAPDSEN